MRSKLRFTMRLIYCFLLFSSIAVSAQKPLDQISEKLLLINTQIDVSIVLKDIATLERLYADDFVFTHGTGNVDNKTSWLKSVSNPNQQFVSRKQDSTQVELHGDVAILTGKITITREQKEKKTAKYVIWYVRVFANKKKGWQLISHRTTKEVHEDQ